MPQGQLRQLSDLQLSERELADVIEAIHTGGAEDEPEQDNTSTESAAEEHCVLCQATERTSRSNCVICQGGGDAEQVREQLRRFADWLSWFKQHKSSTTGRQIGTSV